ncbi:MAG TPA: LLM class flavin-dependent oxidoreductase, partial [Acidimicrobiales bacterium]|nr:LLM class flavin-dependent oxidoreductase [Acidimicrobiales bacterium]
MDPWTLAAAVGPETTSTRLLPAVRVGEFDPPMFARAARSLQQVLDGRPTVNIISSELAGESLSSEERYARSGAPPAGVQTLSCANDAREAAVRPRGGEKQGETSATDGKPDSDRKRRLTRENPGQTVERVTGIEPAFSAWEADVL